MTIKDLTIPDDLSEKFDLVVRECSGALSTGVNSIKDSLVVMNGIRSLKAFFNTPEVQELVEMSQESPAGFLTDRSKASVFKHNKNPNKKYEMKPYTYEQIVEALIPCCLEGYRMHGNEINIISGKGMPVKAGKYRRILELTDGFQESISTPAVQGDYAFIKCYAKWKIDGRTQTIGYEEGDEVHIKLKFGKWDSFDKVRGLAQSKLYSQVLTRIMGKFIPEEPDGVITGEAQEVEDKAAAPPPIKPSATKKTAKKEPKQENLLPNVKRLQELYADPEYNSAFDELFSDEAFDGHEIRSAISENRDKDAAGYVKQVEAKRGAMRDPSTSLEELNKLLGDERYADTFAELSADGTVTTATIDDALNDVTGQKAEAILTLIKNYR